jgi:glycosyltransferase involved in cell wall biosynthesis
MRIAMLSSISWRTPPRAYGPWELMTSLLTEGLIARGVDVTLFATADSLTAGRLEAVAPRGYSEDPTLDAKVWEIQHVANLFEQAERFDLIHNQADFIPLAFSRLVSPPMVTTIHGFSSERIVPVFRRYDDRVHYVAISDADRHADLHYAATIHHGIRIEDFPFHPEAGEHLLFYGRIHADKGAGEAIRAARASGHRLIMAGIIQDEAYHAAEVAPFLDGNAVKHIGVVGGPQRAATLGQAKALIHLIGFAEPFGLSVVEAMACGTPVIAYRRGSMSELIEDGLSGFLVGNLDEALRAIERVEEIDRAACRRVAEQRFSVETMVDRYLRLYERILAGEIPPTRHTPKLSERTTTP